MPRLRPLTPDDAAAADAVAAVALDRTESLEDGPARDWYIARVAHLAATDPGGAWLAEDDDGRVAGLALALVRERIWGLSLFAVDERVRGRGIGRSLLQAAWRHGREQGATGHLVLAGEHPAALRAYLGLGLDLLPVVAAAGIPDLTAAPDGAARVEHGDVALADAIGREVRGAGHGPDLALSLANGSGLLVFEDRAFALTRGDGSPALVAGRDEAAAATVLWGALAAAPRGGTVHIEFMDAAQQWALRVCHDARLPFSPGGAIFRGGRLGPMRPYLPSGAWL